MLFYSQTYISIIGVKINGGGSRLTVGHGQHHKHHKSKDNQKSQNISRNDPAHASRNLTPDKVEDIEIEKTKNR